MYNSVSLTNNRKRCDMNNIDKLKCYIEAHKAIKNIADNDAGDVDAQGALKVINSLVRILAEAVSDDIADIVGN